MSSETTTARVQIGAMFRGPGPARYLLPGSTGFKIHDPTKYKAPAYSMGARSSKLHDGPMSPGPAYLIPSRMTRTGADGTPRYSLGARTRSVTTFNTPAPGSRRMLCSCILRKYVTSVSAWNIGEKDVKNGQRIVAVRACVVMQFMPRFRDIKSQARKRDFLEDRE